MGKIDDRDRQLSGLMQSSQNGDKAAYSQLLTEIAPLLRHTVHRERYWASAADIEDIVQDILLSLHAGRATYDPSRPFLPWLMAIVRYRLADAARRQIRQTANEVADGHSHETFPSDSTNIIEKHEDSEALLQAIAALPAGQRRAIELTKLKEMSLKEAAIATGSSVGAVKLAVHRGIGTLRKTLKVKN